MKGVVFTEFLEMVEEHFSAEMVDNIIEAAQLPSGGAYTAVGTYSHSEMVSMVVALSEQTGMSVHDVLLMVGQHLFGRFARGYPGFMEGQTDAFDFLAGIESVIHTEVLKLYPDAQLPRFTVEEHTPQRLVLLYESPRHFEDLAEGLMRGCMTHFDEQADMERHAVQENGVTKERFILTRVK